LIKDNYFSYRIKVAAVSQEYKEAAYRAIQYNLSKEKLISGSLTPQAAANIIYSLGAVNQFSIC
jgi:hypothetical protein